MTRHVYEVGGWGVGELWLRDGIVLQHELACAGIVRDGPGPVAPDPRAGASVVRGHEHLGRELPMPVGPGPRMGDATPPTGTLAAEASRVRAGFVPDLCRRFSAHLRGRRVVYADVPVDLDWMTPFQQALAAALRAVPWGEVVSYGELAALAGRPGAARAAGSFCAENRYALIVPCHRVVAAGGIGGYGASGVELKRRLLALEGVRL